MPGKLKAGAASVCITPPVGVDLCGFAGRDSGSVGVHDDLYAKALVLDDGKKRVAIVTADLIGLDFETVNGIREGVSAGGWADPGSVMISCSHTHSGPATRRLRSIGETDGAYMNMTARKIVGAVAMACRDLAPSSFGFGRGDALVGINRRMKREDGITVLGENPGGPVAPWVDVIRVDREDGSPYAVLSSHAAHPVVMARTNLLVSADYPGYAMHLVEKNEPVISMFAQGCCGNINSKPVAGTFEDVKRLGTILGAEIVKTFESIGTSTDVSLDVSSALLKLPLMELPPKEELVREAERCRSDLKRYESDPEKLKRSAEASYLKWTEDAIALLDDPSGPAFLDFPVQAVRIGDGVIVGLPGEIFVEYALEIRSRSPFDPTMVLGYTNGVIGYVPTREAYGEGGYEVDTAYKFYGVQMISPESEEIITAGVEDLLFKMK